MGYIDEVLENLSNKYSSQVEFLQSVREVLFSIRPLIDENEKKYREFKLLEKITEPDRIIRFKVPFVSDIGEKAEYDGYRVQYNNVLGPYKGGLRFHESVNESILKFLGFEQIFKNSLTGLPMGGGKGGSNFNPKGKSEAEIKRFCYAFIDGLYKYIGATKDVPAGDIGVGSREIGFMRERYTELTGLKDGTFTGKPIADGGSYVRKEATGFGVGYITECILNDRNENLTGKTVCISGSGNVATYALAKFTELGAKVITMSDSSGYILDEEGVDLKLIQDIKEVRRARISEYINIKKTAKYFENKKPWGIKCDIAAPCATQNEISQSDAKELVKSGVKLVVEGANMPTSDLAVKVLKSEGILYMPGKASNAGGVSVSGLEMEQNAKHEVWTFETVDRRLKEIMSNIYKKLTDAAKHYADKNDFVTGANIAGFDNVAKNMTNS